jgi:hypothetical protein
VQVAKKNGGGSNAVWHPASLLKKQQDTVREVRAVQIYRNEQLLYFSGGCLTKND